MNREVIYIGPTALDPSAVERVPFLPFTRSERISLRIGSTDLRIGDCCVESSDVGPTVQLRRRLRTSNGVRFPWDSPRRDGSLSLFVTRPVDGLRFLAIRRLEREHRDNLVLSGNHRQ